MMFGARSTTGPREANEDSYYYLDFSDAGTFSGGIDSFAMVSDGMGGYQGGDVASGLAVSSAESYLAHLREMAQGYAVELDAAEALREIVQNAHDSIVMEAQVRGRSSMGATFVGAFMSPSHAWIAHVGDSRAYLIRGGMATQLTEDHSQVGRMLSQGLITEAEAQAHPARNRIERALGFPDCTADVDEVDLQQNDTLLFCSDGIYTVLNATTLGTYVEEARSADEAAENIVSAALNANTDDNSTVVVAQREKQRRTRLRTEVMRPLSAQLHTSEVKLGHSQRANIYEMALSSRRRRREERLPSWAIAAVLFVVFVLVAISVFLFTSQNTGGRQPLDTTPAIGASGQEPIETTSDALDESPDESAEQVCSIAQYSVQNAASLKYVDSTGTAQLFSYEPLRIDTQLVIAKGSLVHASTQDEEYGRLEKTYRALDSSYLDDLKEDCAKSEHGETGFSSRLSALFDEGSYERFVSDLVERTGSPDAAGITMLVLDNEALVERGETEA